MRFKKEAFNTVRGKLLIGLMCVTLPLILIMFYINMYAIQIVRDQVARSNLNMVSLYMGQIDRDLDSIDNYLLNLAAQDANLLTLERNRDAADDSYNLARIHLFQELWDESGNYKISDYFFAYSEANDDLILVPGRNMEGDFAVRDKTKQDAAVSIQSTLAAGDYRYDKWVHLKTDSRSYLLHAIKSGDAYVGALVDADRLMRPFNDLDLGSTGQTFLAAPDDKPISAIPQLEGRGLDFAYERHSYKLSGSGAGKYLIVGEPSTKGMFSLIVALPDKEVLKQLPFIQRFVTLLPYACVIVLFVSFLFIRNIILVPINRIVRGMKQLKNGNLNTRIGPHATSSEFGLMNETFNSMAAQIQELKINIYEEQLLHQKAELKHLQLQINPHFFLNSLNIVYYLAQAKNYALIQEMSLCLIEYFRFMFRSKSEFVPLREEVKHTGNYLRIQELRFPGNLTYRLSVPERWNDLLVPPLLIQSFAENTIKHAVSMDRPTCIEVNAVLDETGAEPMIRIRIADNGGGFSAGVLEQLRQERKLASDSGEHIGIWNVKRRLQLLYEGEARIEFGNRAEGGAEVDIWVPVRHNQDEREVV